MLDTVCPDVIPTNPSVAGVGVGVIHLYFVHPAELTPSLTILPPGQYGGVRVGQKIVGVGVLVGVSVFVGVIVGVGVAHTYPV